MQGETFIVMVLRLFRWIILETVDRFSWNLVLTRFVGWHSMFWLVLIFCAVNYENDQQDALYRLIYYSKSAVHVSGDVFAHHQEHLTAFTVSGSVHPSCCRLVSRFGTPVDSNLEGINLSFGRPTAVQKLRLIPSIQRRGKRGGGRGGEPYF